MKVRALRLKKGWSQSKLAIESGVDQSRLSRIEKGCGCSVATLMKLCKALNVSVEELMEESSKKGTSSSP